MELGFKTKRTAKVGKRRMKRRLDSLSYTIFKLKIDCLCLVNQLSIQRNEVLSTRPEIIVYHISK